MRFYATRINLVHIAQNYNISEEKGFPAFSEQTAFALSSVQEDLFANFCFALRLQPLSLSFVAMFSQIFYFQPIVNNCGCIATSAHTSTKTFGLIIGQILDLMGTRILPHVRHFYHASSDHDRNYFL